MGRHCIRVEPPARLRRFGALDTRFGAFDTHLRRSEPYRAAAG
jgi:hypothetical protein